MTKKKLIKILAQILIVLTTHFTILFTNAIAKGKPKIIASTSAVAAIIGQIAHDVADIEIIDTQKSCPHHYHLKPSDLRKIRNADLLIYIDDKFDSFMQKLARKFDGKVIKISGYEDVNFNDAANRQNFHFWLDLNITSNVQKNIATDLIDLYPAYEKQITKNLNNAEIIRKKLASKKEKIIKSLPNSVLFGNSLKHLFSGKNANIFNNKNIQNSSLKSFQEAMALIETNEVKLIILNTNQLAKRYTKFNTNIIYLETENWVQTKQSNYKNLYVESYQKILNVLKNQY